MSDGYAVLRAALLARQQVTFTYGGHIRQVCPHILGWKGSTQHVLAFQFGGTSSSGLPPAGEWRCFEVHRIAGATSQDGAWFAGGPSHKRPQSCVDRVDVQV